MPTVAPLTDYALTFYYPTQAAPTSTVTLKAPEMGDPEAKDPRHVLQDTGGGGLIKFKRGPTLFFLNFEVRFVTRTQRDAFQTWFELIDVNGFELRRPRYHDLDSDEIPNGGFLYQGCEFEDGSLEWRETHRRGFYAATLPRIRATSRSNVS